MGSKLQVLKNMFELSVMMVGIGGEHGAHKNRSARS